jgi:hypothetical protein
VRRRGVERPAAGAERLASRHGHRVARLHRAVVAVAREFDLT